MLHKLQQLSDGKKKIIVWGVTILLGIGLLLWWFPRSITKIQNGQAPVLEDLSEIKLPE